MRKWKECLSPKYVNEKLNVYRGTWMKQMDRCWHSDDGFQVTSRIIITEWGKVEHAAITNNNELFSNDGTGDIPWKLKQEIKNELFGKDRIAIEVFPSESNLIDVMDVYHLWIMPKGFRMPFGIHPTKDKQCNVVNRGIPKDAGYLINNSAEMLRK